MLKGSQVELPAMLAWRETRSLLQKKIIESYNLPLLSFTLNIPGPVKTNKELLQLFQLGLSSIKHELQNINIDIEKQEERHADTGDECFLALRGDAILIKEKMTALEENHPLGRLFDIDVLDATGRKLSRPQPRRCLICGEQAQACARSRRHSVGELTAKIEAMLKQYL